MITNLLIYLLYGFTLLLFWQFVGYPLFMAILILIKKKKDKDISFLPSISILIPTFNEQIHIENRIINLFHLDYPVNKYEIIVVDSGSIDNTPKIMGDIISKLKSDQPKTRLITEEYRKGKASAINFGKKYANFDIILVTDANSKFEKNVLKEIMPHFKDPKVGAVGGRYCVENLSNTLTQSESFYWELESIMRFGESLIDSACLFHGEINAWRKNIADADIKSLSEDLDMCIQIRKRGYKIEYERKAIVYEPSATNVKDQMKQRKRTAIGTIQNIIKHRKYLFFPKDLYSSIIFHSHKTMQIISPFLIISIIILDLVIFNVDIFFTHLVISMVMFSFGFIFLMNLKPKYANEVKRFSYVSIPKIAYYVILNEYLLILAWKDLLLGKYSVLWDKVESSRN